MTPLFPLFLIPASVCLAAAFVVKGAGSRDDWQRVIDGRVLAALRPGAAGATINLALIVLAVVLTALASPSRRSEAQNSHALAEGLIVLVDVSKSMSLSDIAPDRIAAARSAALAISRAAGARPTALIAYAGDAYLAEPFSVDRGAFNGFVAALKHGLIPDEGSAPARALSLAASILEQTGIERARLLVLSDAGGFNAETAEIASRIAAHGHRLDAVLVASPAATMPGEQELAAFGRTIDAGGGVAVPLDEHGNADISALRLDAPYFAPSAATRLALRSTEWQNLSHYLLLLAIVPMLLLFRERRQ